MALALQAQQTLADLAVADFYMSPGKNDLPHLINAAAMTAYRQENNTYQDTDFLRAFQSARMTSSSKGGNRL
ncbi:hypothetical protein N624_1989 [Levilactobacillus brevis]|nr:hypothetical protein N624_1989 [Levilactobacillus brevis]